jgi:hypothetical protein
LVARFKDNNCGDGAVAMRDGDRRRPIDRRRENLAGKDVTQGSSERRSRIRTSAVQDLLNRWCGAHMMSLVRLLGFTTLGCGCVTGRYREVATNREITYVEEKGRGCQHHAHRRNHTLTSSAFGLAAAAIKAS